MENRISVVRLGCTLGAKGLVGCWEILHPLQGKGFWNTVPPELGHGAGEYGDHETVCGEVQST